MARKKPVIDAAARTINIFDGKSDVERETEGSVIKEAEDAIEGPKRREPPTTKSILAGLTRYLSERYESELDGYCLARSKDGNFYCLERIGYGGTNRIALSIRSGDVPILARLFQQAKDDIEKGEFNG